MGKREKRHDGKGGSLAHPRWPDDQLDELRATFGRLTAAELAERFGRSVSAVKAQAKRMELGREEPTIQRVALMLGVNRYTLVRWINAGILPARRAWHGEGRKDNAPVLIDRAGLLDFLRDYRFLYDAPLIADPALRRYVANLPPARERWYTPKEAGALLRATGFLVRRWLRNGDLPGLLVGGRYWVRESALRAFVPPTIPSWKGRKKAEFGGQTPEVESRRARNKAALAQMDRGIRRRHSSVGARVG